MLIAVYIGSGRHAILNIHDLISIILIAMHIGSGRQAYTCM